MRFRIEVSGCTRDLEEGKKPGVKAIRTLIYTTLSLADRDYAKWLHDHGYQHQVDKNDGSDEIYTDPNKSVKPFNFSHPYIANHANGRSVMFKLSSPDTEFVSTFMLGAAKMMQDPAVEGKLGIARIDKCREPFLRGREMTKRYFCLSPIVAQGRTGFHMDARNPEFTETLFNNLTAKWQSVTGESIRNRRNGQVPEPEIFEIEFEKPVAVTNTIGSRLVPMFASRFVLKTTRKLHIAALELGLGQKNGMGFGMIEEDAERKVA